MTANVFSWKKLFYFCLGLTLASAFCMKWIEPDFISRGNPFSIMDLELNLNKEQLTALLAGLDDKTKTIVDYHLHFDFFFMAGVFPGIASICMLLREKLNQNLVKKILFVLAVLQLAAWSFDIYENLHLIQWMKNPAATDSLAFYHVLVKSKFIIAFAGIICATAAFLFSRKRQKI